MIIAGVVLQGLSPVLTKLLLVQGLSRELVVSARYIIAVALLLPLGVPAMGHRQPGGPPRRRDWIALLLVGALGSGVGALLFTAALQYSSAGVVNSISKTAPIFVAFLGYLALRERVTADRLLLVGAMVGADVLIGLGELSFAASEAQARLLGDGLALLAGVTRATSEILAKGALARFAVSTVTFWRFAAGLSVTGLAALVTGAYRQILTLNPQGWAILIALSAVCTALSMFLYYAGTREIPVHVAVSLKILGAIVTVVLSWLILHETFNLYHFAGMAVLISGAYLLVMRTAREMPLREVGKRPAAVLRLESASQLRVRLTLLVVGFTAITALVTTLLSVRHTNATIAHQTRLTMGKVAAVLVQLEGLEEPPSRRTLEQYLRRVVRHRIEGETYSVAIVYIALLDRAGHVLAFALNEELPLMDEDGQPHRAADVLAAHRILALAQSGELARKYDIIPVRAELQRPGSGLVATVEVGCKRSIANRVLLEIVARNTVLVLVLLALGIGLASTVVKRVARPLERIALAMQRLSGGELDFPLFSEGRGEIRQMGDSLQALRDHLRVGGTLRRSLVRYMATQIAEDFGGEGQETRGETAEVAALLVQVPPSLLTPVRGPAALEACLETIFDAVLQNEGALTRYADGYVVSAWQGGGVEDVLWAVLAALELREALAAWAGGEQKPVRLAVDLVPVGYDGAPAGGPVRELAAALPEEGEGPVAVFIGARAVEAVADHIEVAQHPRFPENLLLLLGLKHPPELGDTAMTDD